MVFFLALVAFGMLAFPLVATFDSAVRDGRLSGPWVPLISLVLASLPALEFAFSERDPYRVGWCVGAFLGGSSSSSSARRPATSPSAGASPTRPSRSRTYSPPTPSPTSSSSVGSATRFGLH